MKKTFLAACLSLVNLCPLPGETTTVFVGSGSDGIFTLNLNEETGELTDKKHAFKGRGMGFQEINQSGSLIYSTYQTDGSGAVASFKIDGSALEKISSQKYSGRGLCHVSLDQKEKVLFGADYGGGTVVSFPVAADSGEIKPFASFMEHEGSSVNPQRQKQPHAHSIYAGPDNKFAYAPDLGIDKVKFYAIDDKARLSDRGGFDVPPGSGPRHMKFSRDGKFAYVLNELSLDVSIFSRNPNDGKLTIKKTVSVLPKGGSKQNMSCSEIRVSKDGKFVYTANRDLTDQKRDSVSVLKVGNDGLLTWLQTAPAKVWIPRNINLSPSGKWLLVAGQKSNQVTSHKIDQETGKLTFSGHEAEVPTAMCINFVTRK